MNPKLSVVIAACVVLAVMALMVPVAAENSTASDNLAGSNVAAAESPTVQFITLDPIGNHTIGDIIFINGTTNLPVTEKLKIEILTTKFYTGKEFGYDPYVKIFDIPIFSTSSPGINRYSVNVTDLVVTNLSEGPEKWSPYDVIVHYLNGTSDDTYSDEVITLSRPPQYITLDPIGNHTIGDVIFINGTTNLPITEKLEIKIFTTKFYPGKQLALAPDAYIFDIPIVPTSTSGINWYSVNITDVVVTDLSEWPEKWSPFVATVYRNGSSSIISNQEEFVLYRPPQYITLDPIEDHIVGDEFFINGTTNLSVTDKLEIEFLPDNVELPYADIPNIPIVPASTAGINRYSVNVTDIVADKLGENPETGSLYTVIVHLNGTRLIESKAVEFSLSSPANAAHSVVTPAISPPPSQSPATTTITSRLTVMTSPTTQPSPLPVLSPVAVFTAIAILAVLRRRHS